VLGGPQDVKKAPLLRNQG